MIADDCETSLRIFKDLVCTDRLGLRQRNCSRPKCFAFTVGGVRIAGRDNREISFAIIRTKRGG